MAFQISVKLITTEGMNVRINSYCKSNIMQKTLTGTLRLFGLHWVINCLATFPEIGA